MLKQLVDYAVKSGIITESGYTSKDVNWGIVLDSVTGFSGLVPLGPVDPKKKRSYITFPECPEMDKPLMQGNVKRCHFLVETSSVVALNGMDTEEVKAIEKHKYFIDMLADAGKTIPQFALIARLLQDDKTIEAIQKAMAEEKVKPTDKVTFQLDGEFPVKEDYWHQWWDDFVKNLKETREKEKDTTVVPCFINGEPSTPVATHHDIKGLTGVGGQSSGSVLVGFDKEAYCSYGFEQSSNAAVCEKDMSAYRAGLNDLIRNHSQRLAGTRVVHWFKEKIVIADDPLDWLVESPEQQELNSRHAAKKLLQSIRTGERPDLAQNYYYALTLSGAGGRVMVRDWMEGQFDELVRNINQWFDDLEIVNLDGEKSASAPGLARIVTCLLPPKENRKYDDWIKPIGGERLKLLYAAIKGIPIAYSVIPRLISEHRNFILTGELDKLLEDKNKDFSTGLMYSLVYARMGLIKAYHLRKYRKEGNNTMADNLKPVLNEDFPSPAYQCGCLMAMLAELQRAALGDVGAGVVQRYYAAASTTPALVLGRLTRTSQFHLNKLDPGLAYWYESKIAGIWSQLKEAPPRTLSLEDQSLFAMGYYQQLASMRVNKSENTKEEKEATNG